jgi:hypothetical protein
MPTRMPDRSSLLHAVTSAVALRVDANGRFDLSTTSAGSQFPEITQAQANLLAATWLREFGPQTITYLQSQHGGPIDFKRLHQCGRTLYARSPFGAIPTDLPAPYRKPYGPWYLATFCDGGDVPTVSVAVSAWATDIQVNGARLAFPAQSGNEFFPMGIPSGTIGEFPSSPENAATLAAQNGRLVAAVPELVMPINTIGPPQGARWHVTLDGPVSVHAASLGALDVRELFIGPPRVTRAGLARFVAQPTQPASVAVPWMVLTQPGEPFAVFKQGSGQINVGTIPRRADTPVAFDAVISPEED